MRKILIKNITCKEEKEIICSDLIIDQLETKLNIKLKSRTLTDKVNGYVSIKHIQNNHIIEVVIYEKNNEHIFLNPTKEDPTNITKVSHIRALKPSRKILATEISLK